MKPLHVLAASGTLLLATAWPTAGQSLSAQAAGPPIQLAAEGEFGAKKDEYVQRSRDEMRRWQKKLHDLDDEADAKGRKADAASKSRLRSAWAKTEAESRRLESASADGWAGAKASFEKASKDLKDAWHKIHPEDE